MESPRAGSVPSKQMQLTGRTVPSSAGARLADGDQRNVELCGRGQDRLQLICISLAVAPCILNTDSTNW